MTKETHQRTFAKTISWRVLATFTTMAIVWAFSHNLTIAFSVGITEAAVKMIIYYLHERTWTGYISWGLRK